MNIEKLLQYGWPTLALVAMGLFFWRGVWPLLKDQLNKAWKAVEEARLENQRTTAHFVAALERRDKLMQEGFAELAKLIGRTGRKM